MGSSVKSKLGMPCLAALLCLLLAWSAMPSALWAADEGEAMRQEMEGLKQQMEALQKRLEEMQQLVAELGFAAETVRLTSDRHWTWSATKPVQ